jgi:hypothetical protein
LVISATSERGTFEFIAAKRSGIGWKDAEGVREWSRFYKHSEQGIWWVSAEEPVKKVSGGSGKGTPKTMADILPLLPLPPEEISQHLLIAKAAEHGVGKQTTIDLLKALEEDPKGIERVPGNGKKRGAGKAPVVYRRKEASLHVLATDKGLSFVPGEGGCSDLIGAGNGGLSNAAEQEVLFDRSCPPKGELLPIK